MSLTLKNGTYFIDDNLSISRAISGIRNQPPHRHDFVELVYQFHGACIHTVDGIEFSLNRGDLLLINYHSVHSFSCEKSGIYFNILVKPKLFDAEISQPDNAFSLLSLKNFEEFRKSVNQNNCHIHFDGSERERFEALIFQMEEESKKNEPGARLMLNSGFNMLFTTVFRKMSLPMKIERSGIDENLLNEIKSHYNEKISLNEVAAKCHYNPAYFSRAFKTITGETFTSYIDRIRLENAAELLKAGNLSVGEIIEEIGYGDKTKFFKHFKKRFGTTPVKFSKSNKELQKNK